MAGDAVTTGVNALEFPQISALLNEIVSQASGQTQIAPINTAQFISVAQTGLATGYDPVLNAISQVLSRTIFSIRPYYSRFRGLQADSIRYGNHVRKLQMIDKPIRDDDQLDVCKPDGNMDMYEGCCPEVLQTNWYGQTSYSVCRKIFRDQLNTAFSGPDEFARFISMLMQNVADQIEQTNDVTARMILSNFIAGKIANDSDNVIHLLTEYNALVGGTFTAETIRSPENFPDFARWMFARIKTLSDMLENRSYNFHTNITGKEVQRHTPKRMQKVYITAALLNEIDTIVHSMTFDNAFLRLVDHERVGFWQSIETPDTINVTPVYLQADGTLASPADAVEQANIVGVMFDEEALGYTNINQWSAPTPFNPRGGFSVMWWHYTHRYWNDFTENGIVLLLD